MQYFKSKNCIFRKYFRFFRYKRKYFSAHNATFTNPYTKSVNPVRNKAACFFPCRRLYTYADSYGASSRRIKYPLSWLHTGQTGGTSFPVKIYPQFKHIHLHSTSEMNSLFCSIRSAKRPNLSPWDFSMAAIL